MALIATKSGGNFTLAPAGLQLGRIYGIVDLGTHEQTYMGKSKGTGRFVRVLWELPNQKHVFQEGKPAEPFGVSVEYLLSTHEKAKLRKHLKGWKGKDMTDEEQASFDIETLLGKTGYLNIIHEEKQDKSGKYAKVESISRIPDELKGQLAPPFNKPIIYNTAHGRDAVFNSLPDWLKEKISKSKEFTSAAVTGDEAPPSEAETDSDEPF